MKLHYRATGIWLACLLLAGILLPSTAMARGMVEVDRTDCALSIQYPCSGITFRLYRVADISAPGDFTLTEDFKRYPVSLTGLDSTGWRNLANTLGGYIARDRLSPADTQTTSRTGQLTFSGKTPGLYLVTWDRHTTDGYTYVPQPLLVSLPGLDQDDNWVYALDAVPKYDKDKEPDEPDGPDTVDRRVWKVWKDDGTKRPGSVTVQLLRDEEVYNEMVLSAGNNWKHTWTDLDAKYNWQVVEKTVPDGYTVTVSRDGITFVVTNTQTPSDISDPSDEPELPDVPNEPDMPDKPDTPDGPGVPQTRPDEPDIPQTGQLWWPVPLLACGGMGLFLAGWLKRRDRDSGESNA